MNLLLGIAAIVCGAFQVVGAEDEYVFNYKMTEFYAKLLTQMEQGVKNRAEEMGLVMEQHYPFAKLSAQYQAAIETVVGSPFRRACPTAEHVTALKTLREGYETSRKDCLSKADCKTDLADTTAKIINTIHEFDTQSFKDASACTDDACKLGVQHKLQENLFKLYQDSCPQLRLTADKAMFNTKCYSSMVECMIENNMENMKLMYTGIAKLQNCVAAGGIVGTLTEGNKSGSRPLTWYSH